MYNSNLVSYSVDSKEYCYNVDKPNIRPSKMQAHIPVLMANIPMGLPKVVPSISLVPTMFANDVSCRPTPASVLSTQNFITITKWINDNPYFPSKDDGSGKITRYSKLLVDIFNGDIRNMHICRYI